MKVTRYAPDQELIIVKAWAWGRRDRVRLSLAVDTGSAHTVITPHMLEEIGYGPRDGEEITTVRSAVGKEQGYTLHVKRFSALGFATSDYRIHVFDLPDGFGIDGLIGLSFLDDFNYEIRSAEARILVARVGEPEAIAARSTEIRRHPPD